MGRSVTPASCSARVPRTRRRARRRTPSLALAFGVARGASSETWRDLTFAPEHRCAPYDIPVPPVGRCRTRGCTSCCRGTGRPPGTSPRSHRPALTSPYRSQPTESAGAGLPSRSTHRTKTLRLMAGKSNGKVSMLHSRVESGSRCRRLTLAPLAACPQRWADKAGQSVPRNPRLAITATEF